ncbi:hypothetical protein FHW79_006475 [Azospirillum sp. OGB3]|uniref:DUF411 domain-containing protein n=1 Tax=Azospirillum sp. OGB3 TaxID=2587012 RepID=UPI0016065242|nr:DUF411 domain-containing protein [Azospirillum sp. OGB3]MBB3268799.1 hypothetical protein [Azospirillum sp. OGB3]
MIHIERRRLLRGGLAFALTGTFVPVVWRPFAADASVPELRVYRDASCGCCGAWVKRMEVEGFSAAVITIDDLPRKKVELGLPASLWSCHSATVGGYVLEGHVPPSSVKRLLSERPNVRGIAVPNMPIGSPGMEMGGRKETYAVMIFAEGANPAVWEWH